MTVIENHGKFGLSGAVILVPAYNEAEVIAEVIEDIRSNANLPILVIDDASTDDTVAIARRAGATVIPLAARLGAWGAMQTGIRYALRRGFDIAITMDGDGQHQAECLPALSAPVTAGLADVSIGRCTERGSILRKIAWVILKRVSGLSLADITSGLRVYNKRAMSTLAKRQATLLDYQDVGVLLLLRSRGLHIDEVEVDMRARRYGKSHIFSSWMTVFYYLCYTLILGLSKRPRPLSTGRAAAPG